MNYKKIKYKTIRVHFSMFYMIYNPGDNNDEIDE